MPLSGAQVSRLWPHGSSGEQYGSFAGKTEGPPPVPKAGRFTRLWPHGSIGFPYGSFAGKGEQEPQAATPIGGGYGNLGLFWYFEEHRARRRRELEEIEERERETREIPGELDRQIAEAFRVDELRQAKLAEKDRLQRLADRFATSPIDLPPQVLESIKLAAERRSFAFLKRMEIEISRMHQEEEAAVFAALLLDDD